MPLTKKTKTRSRWQLLNRIALDGDPNYADFLAEVLADTKLKFYNQEMTVILGAIRAKALPGSPGVNNIPAPPALPVAWRRYSGELVFDSTVKKTSKKGNLYVAGEHTSEYHINAQAFRDRLDSMMKLREQENDLLDLHKKPNPGMWLGYGGEAGRSGGVGVAALEAAKVAVPDPAQPLTGKAKKAFKMARFQAFLDALPEDGRTPEAIATSVSLDPDVVAYKGKIAEARAKSVDSEE